jgi:flagellar hook-basal body complex protein FliE
MKLFSYTMLVDETRSKTMDIKAQSLYQEMQGMALQSKMGIGELPGLQENPSASNFAEMLGNALNTVNSMQKESKATSEAFEMGDPSLSLADVMVVKEKAGIAFEATIQVRNKVLEAYKTIMNMPV